MRVSTPVFFINISSSLLSYISVYHLYSIHKMSSNCIVVTLLLLIANTISAQSRFDNRTYVVRKDRVMTDYRLAEFSIFDSTGKQRQYRLRTYYTDIHAALLYTSPSGEIVAMFEGEWTKEINTANISINTLSDKWIDGKITRRFDSRNDSYVISWNGINIIMKGKSESSFTELRDERTSDLLGKFRLKSGTIWYQCKYELIIMSNKMPDAVYFIAVATMDHRFMLKGT